MTDEAALLRAILCDPDDDAPRLIYADWLDENAGETECPKCSGSSKSGHAMLDPIRYLNVNCHWCHGTCRVSDGKLERAEFIRVQCGIQEASALQRAALLQRFAPLRLNYLPGSYRATVNDGIIESADGFKYYLARGFVHRIEFFYESFMQHAKAIFEREPVTEVVLTGLCPYLRSAPNGMRQWFWAVSQGPANPEQMHWVPPDICKAVIKRDNFDLPWVLPFATEEEARRWLSKVAVAWGRELVDLPLYAPKSKA